MTPELKPCRYCDGAPKVDMLRVICTRCSAHTRDFTATLGEFQREQAAAIGAWERGEYKVHPDAIEFARRVLAEVEQSDVALQGQSQDIRAALEQSRNMLRFIADNWMLVESTQLELRNLVSKLDAALASQEAASPLQWDAERLARFFHERYEALAPLHGWQTQKASAVPFDDLPGPNRHLMLHVCRELVVAMQKAPQAQDAERWQPIETAPKDGKPFLALVPWYDGAQVDIVTFERGEFWPRFRSAPCDTPLGWMPLPAVPDAALQAKGVSHE